MLFPRQHCARKLCHGGPCGATCAQLLHCTGLKVEQVAHLPLARPIALAGMPRVMQQDEQLQQKVLPKLGVA